MLRVLKNRLLTSDRLYNFGITTDTRCVLSDSGQESIQHLFFECPFAAYLWSLCKLKLLLNPTINNLPEEALRLKATFKSKTKSAFVAKIALSCTGWHTWQERNNRIFQAQARNKIMVFRKLYEDIHVLVQHCHWRSSADQKELEILSNWGL